MALPTRRFGRTELEIPLLSLGGMRFQQSWTDLPPDEITPASQIHRSFQGRFDLGLGGGRDFIRGEVSPALLKPHSTQRQQRNLELCSAESTGGQRHQPWGRG